MATVKSLEDMLSSEVDESAVTALVGSLESQLSSSSIQLSSQDTNTTSVTVNHVNNVVLVDNVARLLEGSTTATKSAVASPLLIASKVPPEIAPCTTTSSTVSTLPGALPASGYITQVTTTRQNNPTCTINTRSRTAAKAAAASLPNGNIKNAPVVTTTAAASIFDLASVTSQQSHIITLNPSTTTSTPTTPSVVANGKQPPPPAATKAPEKVIQTTVVQQVTAAPVTTVVPIASAKTTIPVTMVQQVVTNPSLLAPGVQIVNMSPRLGVQTLPAGQKTLAPRMMLTTNPVRIAAAPQILTARAGVGGQNNPQIIRTEKKLESLPLQRFLTPRSMVSTQGIPVVKPKNTMTLSPGMLRGAVLLKAENGQLQVVNIAGSSAGAIPGTTYRLQSLPGGGTGVRAVTPQQLVTVPVSAAGLKTSQGSVTVPQTIVGTIVQGATSLNVNSNVSTAAAKGGVIKTGINGNLTTPLTVQTTTANSTQSAPTQMSPNTAKKKCKNFLSTLIRLADEQPTAVAKSVRSLIQGIIDGTMQAEEFTAKLQKELNSAPQPYLVPFLKKNLPYLRHSLITKELTIEGVRPPPTTAVILPHPGNTLQQIAIGQKRPLLQPTTQVRLVAGANTPITTQLLQQNQNLLNQRFGGQRLPIVTSHGKSLLSGKTLLPSLAASSPATVTALQSKYPCKMPLIKDSNKRSFSSLSRDDDDINDVAAMGGVNLIEESQKILASNSDIIGTQIRSCKDESFLFSSALQRRIHTIVKKHGLEDTPQDVITLISHASQIRLKNILEKLSVIAEHRLEVPKSDVRYDVSQDVRCQIKFVEELDRLEKRRHDDQEREILLRAAKSRSKLEDPEQLKLKAKAKEMQRAELEELRQREANTTALLAIGPRKKTKLEGYLNSGSSTSFAGTSTNTSKAPLRPRVKRVGVRDLLHLMEHERETVRKPLLYKSYLK